MTGRKRSDALSSMELFYNREFIFSADRYKCSQVESRSWQQKLFEVWLEAPSWPRVLTWIHIRKDNRGRIPVRPGDLSLSAALLVG